MEEETRLNGIIHTLVNAKSDAVTKGAYKEWSDSYDGDLQSFGYVAPQTGTALFHKALNLPKARIFDAGCGTGQVGLLLNQLGYEELHGADFSPDMLAKAGRLGVYKTLSELNFRNPLPIKDEQYDGVTCIGVYSSFIGPLFLSELIRIIRPGGIIVMSCRPVHFDDDLAAQITSHKEAGAIEVLVHELRPYMTGQNADANYIVMQKK